LYKVISASSAPIDMKPSQSTFIEQSKGLITLINSSFNN
jgi:hypothetical protein